MPQLYGEAVTACVTPCERNRRFEQVGPKAILFLSPTTLSNLSGGAVRLLGSNQGSATCSCVTLNLLLTQFPPLPNGIINMRLSGESVRDGFRRALEMPKPPAGCFNFYFIVFEGSLTPVVSKAKSPPLGVL